MELPLGNISADVLKNWCQPYGIDAAVLRLDRLHPEVSGNKWFKLQGYLTAARASGKRTLLTFGGAWSNHLLATAAAGAALGLRTAAVVRGEAPSLPSPTLQDAAALGMRLFFSSRAAYRNKELPPEVWKELDPNETLVIPEGGYGPDGASGAARILDHGELDKYTHILSAVGTGTTLAGLAQAAGPGQRVIGISVLRDPSAPDAVRALLPEERYGLVEMRHTFHFGGYARHTPELLGFMNGWYRDTGIPSDFVYTGKLFYAADALVRDGHFAPGSRLLLIHSGGLQGNRSLPPGTLIF
ncbi:pyridoxal-phosphate dependent enzyme [Flaviaesturariibacter amylovorans]|uniref:Pyridoxal-phosphate dependent enzyme n=2 Tax=Flaviaesturariibacter amylovorans TaxID=1084520 RepID=A0ABP8H3G8_9BACT